MRRTQIYLGASIASIMLILASVFVWTTAAQSSLEIIWSQSGTVERSVVFSPDGQMVLSGGSDFGVRIRRASDGSLIRTLTVSWSNGADAVAISPDGQYVADGVRAYNGNFNVWRTADGSLVRGRISAHSNGTNAVAFSPDGQTIATAGRDGTIKIWQLPGVDLVRTFNFGSGYRPRVWSIAYSPDGQFLVDGNQSGIDMWRISDGTLVRSLADNGDYKSVAFSPDGQTIAGANSALDSQAQCADCSVKLWRASDGALLKTLIDTPDNPVHPYSLAFSRDGETLVVGISTQSNSVYVGGLRFWRIADGALVNSYNFGPGSDSVSAVAVSPNGTSFAYASYDALTVANNPYSSSCACSLAPTSTSLPLSGGAGSIQMTTDGNCNWTAQSNASWILLTSASSGAGSAVITFEARENPSSSPRSGTLTIGNETFTVVQNGGASGNCEYSLSPASVSYSAGGGVGNINITAGAVCAWSAVSNVSWITITSLSGGIGSGGVSYAVANNPTQSGRKGTITINGHTFAVKQK